MIKKFFSQKVIYYLLMFIFFSIDLSLKIDYSLLTLYLFISELQLHNKKNESKKYPIWTYILGLVVIPILTGMILNYIFTNK